MQNLPEDEYPMTLYDSKTINRLYPFEILEPQDGAKGSKVFTLRLRSDGEMDCLVCARKLPATNKAYLDHHMSRSNHKVRFTQKHESLLAYHKFWINQVPDDQIKQLYFGFCDENVTQCSECLRLLPFSEVMQHKSPSCLLQAVGGTLYDKSIQDTLYRNVPLIKFQGRKYPVILRKNKTRRCLLCNSIVKNLEEHLNSGLHKAFAKSDQKKLMLKKYHDTWSNLPADLQKEQVLFRKRKKKITCTVCSNYILFDSINAKTHLDSEMHKRMKSRYTSEEILEELCTDVGNGSPSSQNGSDSDTAVADRSAIKSEKCSEVITKTSKAMVPKNKTNSPKLNDGTSNSSQKKPTTMSRSSGKNINKSASQGAASKKTNVTNTARKKKSSNNMVKMKCESPRTTNQNSSQKMSNIQSIADETSLSKSNVINTTKANGTQFSFYNGNVNDTIFGNGLLHYYIKIDHVRYPTIQHIESIMHCLVCVESISGIIFHVNSTTHKNNAQNLTVQRSLKKYHEIFICLPENEQMQQKYFRRGEQLVCVLCSTSVRYDVVQVLNHIKDMEHITKMKYFDKNHPIDGEIFEYANFPLRGIRMEEKTLKKQKNASVASAETAITTEGSNVRLNSAEPESPLPDNSGSRRRYDAEVYRKIYGPFHNYFIHINNVRYPVLRTTANGTRCIICDDDGVYSPSEHTASSTHSKEMNNEYSLEKVIVYHHFWMQQDPSLQIHQIYIIANKCILCDKLVSLDSLISHIKTKTHKCNVQLCNRRKNKVASKNNDEHKIVNCARNSDGQHITDSLPSYLSDHLKFLTWNAAIPNEVQCKSCNKTFNDLISLRIHLDSQVHVDITKLQRDSLKYYCDVCRKWNYCETTFNMHIAAQTHHILVNKLSKTRIAKMREQFCTSCNVVIFGDDISRVRHVVPNREQEEVSESLSNDVLQLFPSRQYITSKAKDFAQAATASANDLQKEKTVCSDICTALVLHFPNCRVAPFGSRISGLGYEKSDLDVFVDIGGMYSGSHNQSTEEQSQIVTSISSVLKLNSHLFKIVETIVSARTPIVKICHRPTNLECDVSFRNGLGMENTCYIRLCIELQPVLQPTMLYLKQWSAKNELFGILNSYALTMLMIFYLQTKSHLYPVDKLRTTYGSHGPIINGWEGVSYSKPIADIKDGIKPCTLSVPELLEAFFEYYATFNFSKNVICPLLGSTLRKYDFKMAKLPPAMSRYLLKLNMPNPEIFKSNRPMCLQDPFDLAHNLTKGCNEDFAKIFQQCCTLMKNHLSALS